MNQIQEAGDSLSALREPITKVLEAMTKYKTKKFHRGKYSIDVRIMDNPEEGQPGDQGYCEILIRTGGRKRRVGAVFSAFLSDRISLRIQGKFDDEDGLPEDPSEYAKEITKAVDYVLN